MRAQQRGPTRHDGQSACSITCAHPSLIIEMRRPDEIASPGGSTVPMIPVDDGWRQSRPIRDKYAIRRNGPYKTDNQVISGARFATGEILSHGHDRRDHAVEKGALDEPRCREHRWRRPEILWPGAGAGMPGSMPQDKGAGRHDQDHDMTPSRRTTWPRRAASSRRSRLIIPDRKGARAVRSPFSMCLQGDVRGGAPNTVSGGAAGEASVSFQTSSARTISAQPRHPSAIAVTPRATTVATISSRRWHRMVGSRSGRIVVCATTTDDPRGAATRSRNPRLHVP